MVAASLLTIASAGVGVVTPEVEAEAHRLWEQFCADKREEASIGEMGVYCKFSQDEFQQTYSHELRIAPNPVTKKQVIFIRPATYIYKHGWLFFMSSLTNNYLLLYSGCNAEERVCYL